MRILASLSDDEKAGLLKGEKITPKLLSIPEPKEAMAVDDDDIEIVSALPSPAKAGPSVGRKSRESTAFSEASRRSPSPTKKGKVLTPEEVGGDRAEKLTSQEEAAKKRQEEREAKRIEREEKKKAKEEKQA